jgi:hypothetical protein
LRSNQNVRDKRREWKLDEYFRAYPGVPKDIPIRGGKTERMIIGSARLYVEAHGCMRFVIAIRYSEQEEYRHLVASDLSWRTDDIVKAYTFRWLMETVIEDSKVSCAELVEAMEDGARRPSSQASRGLEES